MLGYHSLGEDSPFCPGTPPGQAPPCAVYAGRYGQQVGGMHPTGMQSCLQIWTFVSVVLPNYNRTGLYAVKPTTSIEPELQCEL